MEFRRGVAFGMADYYIEYLGSDGSRSTSQIKFSVPNDDAPINDYDCIGHFYIE